jgi:magnesium-transporting ATPase (P-type)
MAAARRPTSVVRMQMKTIHPGRGARASIAATYVLFALFYASFSVYSYVHTGDWAGVLAGLPLVLATAFVVGSWMTFIRVADEDEAGEHRG